CADHHGKALGLFVIVELDRYHATDGYAEKLHRRIAVQAAQGLIKAHLHITRRAVGRRHGLAYVGEQGELVVLLGELGVGAVIWGTKGDAAGQDRRDRFGVDGEAVGSNRDVDAAGVPEARVVGDELVIRGVYEDPYLDAVAVVCQAERNHLADLKAAKVHRRTNAQGAQIIGVEGELLAFGAKGHGRRCFQADKFAPGFLGASGVRTDEGPGQQRVYAGYTAGADARAYHPELGVFASEGLGVLIQLDGGGNAGRIIAEAGVSHLADDHVLVLALGLVGFQAFGGLEAHGDLRAGRQPVLHDHGKAHQGSGDGDQPDQRDAHAPLSPLGSAGRCFGAVRVI